ncbi:MAG TPA: iron ABC transporter permease [Firmicutes bacterium]|nr:iron ABC transporter permease [Bacillota bacterium]
MKKNLLVFLVLLVLLSIAGLAGLKAGSVNIPADDILKYMAGENADDSGFVVIMKIRLPRILLAVLIGGMLAVSGAVLQALLRNPLVDPFITGISSGAAFGAAAAIIVGFAVISIPAMAGAVITAFVVYRFSVRSGRSDVTNLLLIGVMTGSFFSALIMMLNAVFSRDLVKVVFWLMGDLSGVMSGELKAAAVFAAIIIAAGILFANDLNIVSAGEEEAKVLGVKTEFVKAFYFIGASLLAGAAVSLSGVIGFVGLIIPHIIRRFTGPDMRVLIPASFLGGAVFLLVSDTLARVVFLPAELPVGVITGLIGAPMFMALLLEKGRQR